MALTSLKQQKIVDHIVSGQSWNLPNFIHKFATIEKEFLAELGGTSIIVSGETADKKKSLRLTISGGSVAEICLDADIYDKNSVETALQKLYGNICEYITLVYYLESANLLTRTKGKVTSSTSVNLKGNFRIQNNQLANEQNSPLSEEPTEYKDLEETYEAWEVHLGSIVRPLWFDTFIPLPSLKDYKKNEYRTDAELEQIHNKKVLNWTRAAAIGALTIPVAVGIMQIINTQDMKIVKPVKVEINADSLAHTLLPMIQQKMSPMTTNTVTISKEKRSKRTAK